MSSYEYGLDDGGVPINSAVQQSFHEPEYPRVSVFEGEHPGAYLPPHMGRVALSNEPLNWPSSKVSPNCAILSRNATKEMRPSLTQAALIAAEREAQWNKQLLPTTSVIQGPAPDSGRVIQPNESLSAIRRVSLSSTYMGIDEDLTKADWEEDLLVRFGSLQSFAEYVMDWLQKSAVCVRASFFDDPPRGHWYSDINPNTGNMMEMVRYPDTYRDNTEIEDPDVRLRRRLQTSDAVSRKHVLDSHDTYEMEETKGKEVALLTKKGEKRGARKMRGEKVFQTIVQKKTIKRGNLTSAQTTTDKPKTAAAATIDHAVAPHKARLVSVPVVAHTRLIRPARTEDLAGILAIYNFEVEKGTQAMDNEPLDMEEFAAIMRTCEDGQLPFLVAVTNTGTEATTEVVGFGFFAERQRGLPGRNRMSKPRSVSAHVYVRYNRRHNGIGSSLLDRLLRIASKEYVPRKDYGIAYLEGETTLASDYRDVFVEISCGNKTGLAEMQYAHVLRVAFGFEPTGSEIKNALQLRAGFWLNKLIFRHDCRAKGEEAQGLPASHQVRSKLAAGAGLAESPTVRPRYAVRNGKMVFW